jgi:hypothetical protein
MWTRCVPVLSRFAASVVLGLTMAACGGGGSDAESPSQANAPSALRQSAQGLDGASVSYTPVAGRLSQTAVAPPVRVARDAAGAPALPEGHQAAGAVYQFTPMDWTQYEMEVRIPFDAAAANAAVSGKPMLLVAPLGGDWMHVSGAVQEGGFLVAQVPSLAYATVALAPESFWMSSQALATQKALGQTTLSKSKKKDHEPLRLSVDASTSPPLPTPCHGCWPVVTQPTNLVLDVDYDFPSSCDRAQKRVVVEAINTLAAHPVAEVLLDHVVTASEGSLKATKRLEAGPKAQWVFRTYATCRTGSHSYCYTTVGKSYLKLEAHIKAPACSNLIAQGPTDVRVELEQTATFTVTGVGAGLSYQWQRSSDGTTFTDVAGQTSASISFPATADTDGNLWRVVVRNAQGCSSTSPPARLTVIF